jgi:hypothetical protein
VIKYLNLRILTFVKIIKIGVVSNARNGVARAEASIYAEWNEIEMRGRKWARVGGHGNW